MSSLRPPACWLTLLLLTSIGARAVAQAPPPAEERTFVLVVGIDDYQDPKIGDLAFAERDAQGLANFFAEHPRSPTTRERVQLIRGAEATRVGVLRAVRDHLIRKAVGPRDTAILYFAGHGFTDPQGTYLATKDTRLADLQFTAIRWAELQHLWSQIGAGRRVFLVDACHSGGLAGLRGPGGIGKRVLAEKVPASGASVLIAATGPNQLSVEDPKRKQGVFTGSVLAGLEGAADADRDGVVSLGELSAYLQVQVPQRAKQAGGNQTPTLRLAGDEAFAKGLVLSRGTPTAAKAHQTELDALVAERERVGAERERAEARARAAEAKLASLQGASQEELTKARQDLAWAKAAATKARHIAAQLHQEQERRVAAEARAAKAEAEAAELRRKLAALEGDADEQAAAERDAAAAAARKARVERFRQIALGASGKLGVGPLSGVYAPIALPKGLKHKGAREVINTKDGSVLIWIPPAKFQMGSPARPDEQPLREVSFARGYYIAKHEVTWGQYQAFCKATKRTPPLALIPRVKHLPGEDHPVYNVSWEDARAYCAWARLRLPSEAEWEYAARGLDAKRRYPWSGKAGPERVNLAGRERALPGPRATWKDAYPWTAPVSALTQSASPHGCLNMGGNVSEWVQDSFFPTYRGTGLDGSAEQRPSAERVRRGGSWRDAIEECTATRRRGAPPAHRSSEIGFRVARSHGR